MGTYVLEQYPICEADYAVIDVGYTKRQVKL